MLLLLLADPMILRHFIIYKRFFIQENNKYCEFYSLHKCMELLLSSTTTQRSMKALHYLLLSIKNIELTFLEPGQVLPRLLLPDLNIVTTVRWVYVCQHSHQTTRPCYCLSHTSYNICITCNLTKIYISYIQF